MKALIFTILSVAVFGLLVFTNPKMEDYESFIRARIIQGTQNSDSLGKTFGFLFGGFASRLVSSSTTRSDYVFFSVYETNDAGNHVQMLGELNNFFMTDRKSLGLKQTLESGGAYPGDQEYTRRAKRSEAKALLADISARMERYYFDNNTYTDTLSELGYTSGAPESAEGHYTASVSAGLTGDIKTS